MVREHPNNTGCLAATRRLEAGAMCRAGVRVERAKETPVQGRLEF